MERFTLEKIVPSDATNEKRKRRLWSKQELFACVYAYRTALIEIAELERNLAQEELRERKKEILRRKEREAVAAFIEGRPATAYEPRMQNITHLLSGLGLETISNYPPLPNVGVEMTPWLLQIINSVWERGEVPELPTDYPDDLKTRVQSAVTKIKADPTWVPPLSPVSGQRVESVTKRFIRDPNVIAWVLVTANGRCEACDDPAPFVREDGEPYLEVHHVRPLAEGGPDSTDNAIAVCPACHRRFHYGEGKRGFRQKTIKKIGRLVDYPMN